MRRGYEHPALGSLASSATQPSRLLPPPSPRPSRSPPCSRNEFHRGTTVVPLCYHCATTVVPSLLWNRNWPCTDFPGVIFGGMRGIGSPATRSYLHSPAGDSPETRRSTLDPDRGYYGESPARLRRGPRDCLAQGRRNRRPEPQRFGAPNDSQVIQRQYVTRVTWEMRRVPPGCHRQDTVGAGGTQKR